jgi:hypothetical protein
MPAHQQTLAECELVYRVRIMKQFLMSNPAQLLIWLSVLAILVVIGGYTVGRFRGRADDVRLSANDLLTNFRDLHHRGDIADTEFRNIKTVLGVKLQQELNGSVGEGSIQKSESSDRAQLPDDTDRSDA